MVRYRDFQANSGCEYDRRGLVSTATNYLLPIPITPEWILKQPTTESVAESTVLPMVER